uniref:Uncharacterized protein n=1 Tax=Papio anubis TaxID=9555 RepID=A0A2I3LHR9_PAPAN
MLGVNVAKSSLHLHFLKTLEFRNDVSVTSMPEVAGAIRANHFTPTILPWGSKTGDKATACPDPSVHAIPSKVGPCQHNLWASDTSWSVCLSSVKGKVSLSPSSCTWEQRHYQ